MSFEELQFEYRERLVGDVIYSRVLRIGRLLLRHRDPATFARGAHDYRDGLEDVTNEFVFDVLIRERQIDYVMITARDLNEFDRLIRHHLRRYVARTRTRTVFDNLIDRSIRTLREAPFTAAGAGSDERFILAGKDFNDGQGTPEAELRSAAALAQAVPKVRSQGDERAPKVYDAQGLLQVLLILFQSASGTISRRDLQTFFGFLLSGWAPSFLGLTDEQIIPAETLSPAEEAVVNEAAEQLVASMSTEERIIFQYKFANLSDSALAAALNLSRQSTAPRKHALFERIRGELGDMESHLQEAVLGRANEVIVLSELEGM